AISGYTGSTFSSKFELETPEETRTCPAARIVSNRTGNKVLILLAMAAHHTRCQQFPLSLASQRHNRIQQGRAPCRNETGGYSNGRNPGQRRDDCERIARMEAK